MLIAIEGCVGAGKSTVVEGLARYRGSATLFEDFELNPFLTRFYEDPAAHALETEFAFLLIHYHQLKRRQHDGEKELITDFFIAKDLVYADLNLNDPRARQAFQGVYDLFLMDVVRPDIVVCLSASDELLLERIRKRNRPFEQQADPGYYIQLNAAFETFFEDYEGQKLVINMDESDFVADHTLYSLLSRRIDAILAG
ncbi:MAG: deoxynucleoside kinase [Planctomycetes bacterium]|nr:deoxynucleoside kinase [Planctomycetota bacterium]